VGSGVLSVRLWAPSGCAGAALGGAVRALWVRPLGVPGKALRPRWPAGYQARLRRPGNAVLRKITHPLNIIDFTPEGKKTFACLLNYSIHHLTQSTAQALRLDHDKYPQSGRLAGACSRARSTSQPRHQKWQPCRRQAGGRRDSEQGERCQRGQCCPLPQRRRRRRRQVQVPRRQPYHRRCRRCCRRQVQVPRRQQCRQLVPRRSVRRHHLIRRQHGHLRHS